MNKALSISETVIRGSQQCYKLTNGNINLLLTKYGLNIASLTRSDDPNSLNPFWIPQWTPANPDTCPHLELTGSNAELYGNGEDGQLLSNIVGHNICLDRFGACKKSDEPRTVHGEAPITLFNVTNSDSNSITFAAKLPKAMINLERSFALINDLVKVSTTVTDLSGNDVRTDIEWCEHVTLGDPFLDGIEFITNCDEGYRGPFDTDTDRFKEKCAIYDKIDINEALSIPKKENKSISIEEISCLRNDYSNNESGLFIATNKELGYKLEYNWNKYTFPWLCLWTEHYARKHTPWNGNERTRGMEFSTKPFPMPENESILPVEEVSKDLKTGQNMWRERSIDMVVKGKKTEEMSFKLSYL